MAKQTINTGGSLDSPAAESIASAFAKVNAMTSELFTTFSLGGRLAIDLDASPDTIRDAFVKTNTNLSALYTDQSLPGVPVINVGAALDDAAAESIYAAFTKVNTGMTALYAATVTPPAGDYYVATTGSDSNPGTSLLPFRTLTKGISVLSAGKTLIVRSGVYTDFNDATYGLRLSISGTASQPITIKSEILHGAVIDAQHPPQSGRQFVVYILGSYIILDGFDIKRGYKDGVFVGDYANYNIIRNNRIHDNGTYGDTTSTFGFDGVFTQTTTIGTQILSNYIYHNGRFGSAQADHDHGIYNCGDNEVIANNVIVDNASSGIQVAGYTNLTNCKVYNNTFAWNKRGMWLYLDLTALDIKNNIFYKNTRVGIESYNAHGTGVVFSRNIFFGNGSNAIDTTNGGSNYTYTIDTSIIADPLFVHDSATNPAAGGFKVQSGSPAINAGLTLSAVSADLEGVTRPQGAAYDIGAYEYVP